MSKDAQALLQLRESIYAEWYRKLLPESLSGGDSPRGKPIKNAT